MKTIAYLMTRILITLCLIVSGCSQNGQFTLLDGQKLSFDDFAGQWVVVNFWAEWCAPCLEEVPELNRLARAEEEHNIAVIGISYDPLKPNELKNLVQKWQLEYPVMNTEPVPILPFGLPQTLPTNYLIDPQGRVAAKLVGKQNYNSLVDALNQAKTDY